MDQTPCGICKAPALVHCKNQNCPWWQCTNSKCKAILAHSGPRQNQWTRVSALPRNWEPEEF